MKTRAEKKLEHEQTLKEYKKITGRDQIHINGKPMTFDMLEANARELEKAFNESLVDKINSEN